MPNQYTPDGYTSVTPYLIVDGADRTIEFARRVFDVVEVRRWGETADFEFRASAPGAWYIDVRTRNSGGRHIRLPVIVAASAR